MNIKDLRKNEGKNQKKLLARKKLLKLVSGKPEKGHKPMRITDIYQSCGLEKICTYNNFATMCKNELSIPSWKIMWAIRKIVNPAEWFFYEDEHPGPDDMIDITPPNLPDYRKSTNFKRIGKITNPNPNGHGTGRGNNEISAWCQRSGISYMSFYMLRSGQRPLSTKFVLRMRKTLPPKLWFDNAAATEK
ncbi:MAG: hypothetical protein II837_06895 [Treponema sp.]|nr:hypothetical protein [Treponema sp.]